MIKPIATRKSLMHRLFGNRFAPRLSLGLTDYERRALDDKRRFRNLVLLGIVLVALGLSLLNVTR